MTRIIVITLAILCSASLMACDDGEGSLSTSQSALSTSQAFDACIDELAGCRLPDADLEECRQLEFECAPDRASEREGEWRAFCDGVDARCEGGDLSEEMCEELQARCEAGAAKRGAQEELSPEECYAECMGALDDSEACAERCQIEVM